MRPFKSLEKKFRHVLKSSTSIYERSGLHFLGTTTGIQSRPDAFNQPGSYMNIVQFQNCPRRKNR